ncbi:hypothetical protein PENTCL1PPCAC_28192, partial [Pristionchus entomophagus]
LVLGQDGGMVDDGLAFGCIGYLWRNQLGAEGKDVEFSTVREIFLQYFGNDSQLSVGSLLSPFGWLLNGDT